MQVAVSQLHRHVGEAVWYERVEVLNDIGMLQVEHHAGLGEADADAGHLFDRQKLVV